MSNLLDVEEKNESLPILCIFGGDATIQRTLVHDNASKFRIILVAKLRPKFLESYPSIYFLTYENVTLLPKLQESVSYALTFINESNIAYTSPLIEKLEANKSQVLFVFDVDFLRSNALFIQKLKGHHNARFAVKGELLRKKSPKSTHLSKIIENAILNGEIRLSGNETYPIYASGLSDLTTGLMRLLFGNFRKDTIYYLFYKRPETLLEAAHLIGRVEPELQIHFSDTANPPESINRNTLDLIVEQKLTMQHDYLETSTSAFEKELHNLFARKNDPEEELLLTKKVTRKKRGKLRNIIKLTFLSFFFGLFLFLFSNLLMLGVGLYFLKGTVENIKANNFQNVEQTAGVSKTLFSIIRPSVSLFFDSSQFLDSKGTLEKNYNFLEKGIELSTLTGITTNTLTKTQKFSSKNLSGALANLSFIYQEGQRIQMITNDKTLSSQLKNSYSKLLSFSEILPIILGFSQEKNYLLLFQNNEELRPTGGFIGSVGDLTLKEGRAKKLSIQDVYELDGQLRNHVEPPFVVRRYLQPHLYLRDSNFYLDFQEAASKAAEIYYLETSKEPDAVIAIDLQVLKEFLKITGPISLPTYDTTVTSDTISDFIQGTIKDNFFPGSTGKRDVLNAVLNQLVEKSVTDPKFYTLVMKAIPDLLEEKHILVSFSDNSIQKAFSANLYAGENIDRRISDSRTIKDYLYVNEGNIGVNKANKYVSREIKYSAMVGQGKLNSKASLVLTNASPVDDYKTYITFATPKGSSLSTVNINGIKQSITAAVVDFNVYEAKSFKIPQGLEVETFQKNNHTIFSFIANAKKGDKTTVEISYENGAAINLPSIINYSLLTIKQPGTLPYNLQTTIDYPEGYLPVDTKADSYGKNFLEQNSIIKNDSRIDIQLQRKQ